MPAPTPTPTPTPSPQIPKVVVAAAPGPLLASPLQAQDTVPSDAATEVKRLKATVDTLERRLTAREDVIADMTRDKKKQDTIVKQQHGDLQAHITNVAESQARIADLMQHSIRLQEALVIAQSQLQDAKHVMSVYEDRISRLEYDVGAKTFPTTDVDVLATADFSLGTYPDADSMTLPYDLIEGSPIGCEDEGVEESKGDGSEDGDEAVETDGSEDDAEAGIDSARDSDGRNLRSRDGDSGSDSDSGSGSGSDSHSGSGSGSHSGIDGEDREDCDDREDCGDRTASDEDGESTASEASASRRNDCEDGVEARLVLDRPHSQNDVPPIQSPTLRRVILKKGDSGAKPSVAFVRPPSESQPHDASLVARVKAMSARDMTRLTVPELTEVLEALGKAYCKPKAAAVALLMTTAKDL